MADVNDLNPDKNERPTPEQVISDGNDHCGWMCISGENVENVNVLDECG